MNALNFWQRPLATTPNSIDGSLERVGALIGTPRPRLSSAHLTMDTKRLICICVKSWASNQKILPRMSLKGSTLHFGKDNELRELVEGGLDPSHSFQN